LGAPALLAGLCLAFVCAQRNASGMSDNIFDFTWDGMEADTLCLTPPVVARGAGCSKLVILHLVGMPAAIHPSTLLHGWDTCSFFSFVGILQPRVVGRCMFFSGCW